MSLSDGRVVWKIQPAHARDSKGRIQMITTATNTMPPARVIEAVITKFSPDYNQAAKVIAELKYDSVKRCWYFFHAGMYHGVDPVDGFIGT
jgi:hypothetical protein